MAILTERIGTTFKPLDLIDTLTHIAIRKRK